MAILIRLEHLPGPEDLEKNLLQEVRKSLLYAQPKFPAYLVVAIAEVVSGKMVGMLDYVIQEDAAGLFLLPVDDPNLNDAPLPHLLSRAGN